MFTNIWSQQYAYGNVTVIAGKEIINKTDSTVSEDQAENQPNSSEDTLQNLERELEIEETKQPA